MCVCCTKSLCFTFNIFSSTITNVYFLAQNAIALFSRVFRAYAICYSLSISLRVCICCCGTVFIFYFRAVTHPRCCAFCLFYDSLFYHFLLFFLIFLLCFLIISYFYEGTLNQRIIVSFFSSFFSFFLCLSCGFLLC